MQIGNTGPSLNALPNYMYIKQKINSHYRFKYNIKCITKLHVHKKEN